MVTADITWGWGLPFLAIGSAFVSLRTLMRCDRCRKSVLWWAATNAKSADFWRVAGTLKTCPYCGHDG